MRVMTSSSSSNVVNGQLLFAGHDAFAPHPALAGRHHLVDGGQVDDVVMVMLLLVAGQHGLTVFTAVVAGRPGMDLWLHLTGRMVVMVVTVRLGRRNDVHRIFAISPKETNGQEDK